jgi:succinate-acetate transporter protein
MTGSSGEEQVWAERDRRLESVTRVVLRPVGSPVPLGLFGLTAATWVLSAYQLGWIDVAEGKKVALVAIGFASVAQLVASIFAFLARDGVVATALGELALIWLVTGLVMWTLPPGAKSDALGFFLLFAGVTMVLTATSAAQAKLVPALVFATAGVRFFLGGIEQVTADEIWQDLAGIVGLALTGLAIYGAWAAELEDAQGKTVLPLGRRGRGKEASELPLLEQVRELDSEGGVKKQL